MVKKLKVHEKPAFKTRFVEVDFPKDTKKALALLKEAAKPKASTYANGAKQAYAIYDKDGDLYVSSCSGYENYIVEIPLNREDARRWKGDGAIYKVTIIRGDRVR